MASPAILKVNIVSDFDRKGIDKGDQALRQLGRGAQVAAAALGGALLAGGLAATKAAEKGATANARLANVLTQTAGASDKTVASVQAQAEELSRLTGLDDDVVKGGQAILGTFKSVAATAGQTGGVFDRATTSAADLAAAGFGSVESNATALGKALEDPTKGLTALARSGVTFTAQEKEKIKALQESGKTLEAQGIILDAIEGQVAGTAEATANGTDKMREGFDEVLESLGQALLPVVDQAAAKFQALAGWVQENTSVVLGVVKAVAAFVAIVTAATVALKVYQAAVIVYNAVTKAAAIATKAWAVAQRLLNLAMRANPIGLIVTLVAALIAAVVTAYKKNETFRKVVQRVWAAVKAAIEAVVDWFGKAWDVALSLVRGYFNAYKAVVTTVFNVLKTLITSVSAWFVSKFRAAKTTVVGIFEAVKASIETIMGRIKGAIETAVDFGIGLVNGLIDKVNAVITLINKVPGVNVGKLPSISASSASVSPAASRASRASVGASPFAALSDSTSDPGGTSGAVVQVDVHLQDRRLQDLIKVEVSEVQRGTARRILQGAA